MDSKNKVSEIFAENVFTDKEMKKRLRGDAYAKYKKCIDAGVPFDRPLADEIAAAMKEWAIGFYRTRRNQRRGGYRAFFGQKPD